MQTATGMLANGCSSIKRQAKHLVETQTLPLLLIGAVSLGLLVPSVGQYLAGVPQHDTHSWLAGVRTPPKGITQTICVFVIFFLSGMYMETEDIKQGARAWCAALFGFSSILLLSPALAMQLIRIPVAPRELAFGVAVFGLGPTSLNAGIVLTQQARGNVPLALTLTVLSNVLALFTLPLSVPVLVGMYVRMNAAASAAGVAGADPASVDVRVNVDPVKLLTNLLITVLIPLVVGRLAAQIKTVADFFKRNKANLKHSSSILLAVQVFMSVSRSVVRLWQLELISCISVTLLGIFMYLMFVCLNFCIGTVFAFNQESVKALVFTASSKTLPVPLMVYANIPESVGQTGVMVVGTIVVHLTCILVASALASYWGGLSEQSHDHELVPTHDTECAPDTSDEQIELQVRKSTSFIVCQEPDAPSGSDTTTSDKSSQRKLSRPVDSHSVAGLAVPAVTGADAGVLHRILTALAERPGLAEDMLRVVGQHAGPSGSTSTAPSGLAGSPAGNPSSPARNRKSVTSVPGRAELLCAMPQEDA